ncbi:MAG: 3'-5' exonuclease [Peptococcaceae bacterium]|nr:3'-5' exonuclease [Peptococcaceae bacterium]
MRAICIDFETANSFLGSICSVGIAIIEDSRIVDAKHWLVKPHPRHLYFNSFNVGIHGINKEAVKDAAEFDAVYKEIEPLLNNSVIVAHNASFDISVLRQALDLYGIEYPEISVICTYKTALKTWQGLENYKLNTVCKFINHSFKHHDAQEDAVACGRVLLSAVAGKGFNRLEDFADAMGIKLGKLSANSYYPCRISRTKK